MVTGTPELAGAVDMRNDPLVSCWQQGVNGGGQLYIKVAEAAEIMGGQLDRDAVVDVAPIRMVAAGFGQQGHLAHEAKGLTKSRNTSWRVIRSADRVQSGRCCASCWR